MTILIIDDNALMRATIGSILRAGGAECVECDDGIHALDFYRQFRPAWVLMDIKMRGMDGLEATRSITTACPEARVVIVTEYDDKEMREEARKAGAVSYVHKEHLMQLREICFGRQSHPAE